MSASNNNTSFIEWVTTWDYAAIWFSLVAAAIFAIITKLPSKGFELLSRGLKNTIARRRYRRTLMSECRHLIVVGKRSGFTIEDTYIPLDVMQSELMHGCTNTAEIGGHRHLSSTCVLIGGPGAGKSTLVKHRIIHELRNNRPGLLPFLVRLRGYDGCSSIEELAKRELTRSRFVDPERLLQDHLLQPGLCVLDGLDEVKPDARLKVIRRINEFYNKYYTKNGTLIVTCRREAYLDTPLDIPTILEVGPLRDHQIRHFASKWPPGYPQEKSAETFWHDLAASPQVLALARSPLLLVGGLMQYTETGSGIPDERYKYLGRVAQWLIADWATAQGHPPDRFRKLYDRLLPKIAFEMHKKNTADMSIEAAQNLVRRHLPTFGLQEDEALEFISSLRNRTGIMVHNDSHHLIFCQFGMQEYFGFLRDTCKT